MAQLALSALGKGLFSFVLMAVLAAICAVIIRGIVLVLARSRPKAPVVAPQLTVPMPKPVGEEESDIVAAVIAAAAHVVSTPHRIVFLAEQTRSANWISEVRARHHGGHSPRR